MLGEALGAGLVGVAGNAGIMLDALSVNTYTVKPSLKAVKVRKFKF